MFHKNKFLIKIVTLFCLCIFFKITNAQVGELSLNFTPEGGKPNTILFSKPIFKFDNAHGYWFINPHTGNRHFNLEPDQGFGNTDAAFISFNGQENDLDLYQNDTTSMSFENRLYALELPAYNRRDEIKPMHLHFTTFTASEIAFTLSGNMFYTLRNGGTSEKNCTVTGTGHFYRESKYASSASMPGCNCDQTIYATVYDEENNIRTASGCENALSNKIFDAMQKTFAPVFNNVGNKEEGKMSPGNISIIMLAGHTNIDVPAKERNYCDADYKYNRLTSLHAERSIYNNDDGYGIRLIKIPADEQLNGTNSTGNEAYIKNIVEMGQQSQALLKSYMAKEISLEEYQKKSKALSAQMSAPQQSTDNFEKAKIEADLSIKILINPYDPEMLLLKMCDKNKTVVQHIIKGAAFEIYSPSIKDSDGTYLPNRRFIYFGKYTTLVKAKSGGGFDAETTKAIYPSNGSKLNVYNIIIKLEGSQDMIDKAVANIDYSQIISLISKQ